MEPTDEPVELVERVATLDLGQAAWVDARMGRWGQGPLRAEARNTAMAVFRPDLYDAALASGQSVMAHSEAIGAFAGPAFDAGDIEGHLRAFAIGRWKPAV